MSVLPSHTPEFDALGREIEALRDELARLLFERGHLLEFVGPQLESRYLVALGALQLEVLAAECDVRRLRRTLELVWEALNRSRLPDLAVIEIRLNEELAEWKTRLDEETQRLSRARERARLPVLNLNDTQELRTLFRGLAKLCHPDVNPNGGERARRLWQEASDAYARGDLGTLRALALLAANLAAVPADERGMARQRRDELSAAIERVRAELDEIRTRFPFSMQEQIKDDEWLAAQQARLAQKLEDLKDEHARLQAALAQTLSGGGDV